MMPAMMNSKRHAFDDLIAVMKALRSPETGCPWDLEQDFASIAPYTIEEAYEVADAIAKNDRVALREELGDLLFQPIYHAQMAAEEGAFDIHDVIHDVTAKMIHRHPHVFGDEAAASAGDVDQIWDAQKDKEKTIGGRSILDDVPLAFPALLRAHKLQKRAAKVGFEWPDIAGVREKLTEELAELAEAEQAGSREEIADELGDLFFVLVNYARMSGYNAEDLTRAANDKFERRFRAVEDAFARRGQSMKGATLDEMEAEWQRVKAGEG